MSMKYLLDTNVFREVGKDAPHRHVGAWLSRVDDSDVAVSALTVREVRKGIAPGCARANRRLPLEYSNGWIARSSPWATGSCP